MRFYIQVFSRALLISISLNLGILINPGATEELAPASLSDYKASTNPESIRSSATLFEDLSQPRTGELKPEGLSVSPIETAVSDAFGNSMKLSQVQAFEQMLNLTPTDLSETSLEVLSHEAAPVGQRFAIAPVSPKVSSYVELLDTPLSPKTLDQTSLQVSQLDLNLGQPIPAPTVLAADPPAPAADDDPFKFPPREPDFRPSQGIHCDVLEHLKTPRTYRRLDAYMRPTAFMPKDNSSFWKRDYATGEWGGVRTKLYDYGFEVYGCYGYDMLRDIVSNISDDPAVKNTPARDTQFNLTQTYGGDIYSRIINKNWKGGQFHWSVTWPESKYPLYSYRNNLNPTGTGQIHGHFYTDQGLGPYPSTDQDQGLRLFELWIQQRYGKNRQSYVRFGNVFPMIQFNRSILSDLFNFWTFTEPCMLGTTYFTGNAPCYPQAPLSLQVYQILNKDSDLQFQIMQGYYGSTGRNNIRGVSFDLRARNGVEMMLEYTLKGGTYSMDPKKNGKPWFVKLGGQYHTGVIFSNRFDINGNPAALTGLRRQEFEGNYQVYLSTEYMLYREKGSYGEGLTMFAKAGGAHFDDRNVVKRWYTAGFGYEGLFPKRPRDVLYAGWARVDTTDGFVKFQRENNPCRLVPNCRVTGTQDVFEAGYSMELTPWFWVTPMFQYLRSPNTRTDLGDIFAFGVATRLSF